ARVGAGGGVRTAALGGLGPVEVAAPPVEAHRDGGVWRLEGTKASVPAASVASRVLVPAATAEGVRVFLVDPRGAGADVEPVETTDRQSYGHLVLSGARGEDEAGVGGGRGV